MLLKQRSQNWNKFLPLTVMVLSVGTLAGCVGQKYGFPGFGTKQASTSDAGDSPQNSTVNQKSAPAMNHVAGTPVLGRESSESLISATSVNKQRERLDDSVTGRVRISDLPDTTAPPTENEIDEAFRKLAQAESPAQQQPLPKEMKNYKKLVSQVDQGVSPLDALKASFEDLEKSESAQTPQSSSNVDLYAQFVEEQKQNPIKETSGIVIQPATSSKDATEKNSIFPWAKTPQAPAQNEIANIQKEQIESQELESSSGLGHIRNMLAKSQELIRNNNLLDARVLAETASSLKEKTKAAFTHEEVTPEQVLAEIAAREQQRKEKLLAGFTPEVKPHQTESLSEQATQKPLRSAPVFIDLSREWVNNSPAGNVNEFNEITKFEQSVNQPLRSPANSIEQNEAKPILINPGNTMPVLENALNSQPASEDSAPIEHTSYLPPQLPFGNDDQLGNQAPMLIAPGVNSAPGNQQDAEFDEFAAGFANVTVADASEIEEAPLLIDESELSVGPADSNYFSTMNLSMMVCGIAFASFMLIRRR